MIDILFRPPCFPFSLCVAHRVRLVGAGAEADVDSSSKYGLMAMASSCRLGKSPVSVECPPVQSQMQCLS